MRMRKVGRISASPSRRSTDQKAYVGPAALGRRGVGVKVAGRGPLEERRVFNDSSSLGGRKRTGSNRGNDYHHQHQAEADGDHVASRFSSVVRLWDCGS